MWIARYKERPWLMTWFCPSIMSPDTGPGAGTMAPPIRTIPHLQTPSRGIKYFNCTNWGPFVILSSTVVMQGNLRTFVPQ